MRLAIGRMQEVNKMQKPFQHSRARSTQRGFTLIELIVVMAIGAVLAAVVNSQKTIDEAEETIAHGTAEYLMVLREGVNLYQQTNYLQLEQGDPVVGFANPLAPTVAELKAKSFISSGTPATVPLGFVPVMSVNRAGCPGVTCQITGMVRTPTSFTSPRTGNQPRYDLAMKAQSIMRGTAGLSFPGDTSVIRGSTFSVPNPVAGTPGAVLATVAFMNTSFYNQFVRIQDTRDPDLQGNLSAKGDLTIQGTSSLAGNTTIGGNLAVTGTSTLTGALLVNNTINATGNVTSQGSVGSSPGPGCNRAELLPDGRVIGRSDCANSVVTQMDPLAAAMNVKVAGVDRVLLGGANVELALRNATGTMRARVGQDGQLAAADVGGAVTAQMDGSSGRGTLRMANLTSTAVANTPCSTDGDIVRDADTSGGTILLCTSGTWKPPGLRSATANAPCTTVGIVGQDSAGIAYICRGSPSPTWQNINDRVTRSVLMARYLVSDGVTIPKPVCPAGASQAVVVMPSESGADYAAAPPRNRFTASAIDSGGNWVTFMRLSDGTGVSYANSFAGPAYNFQGIASTYCDFTS